MCLLSLVLPVVRQGQSSLLLDINFQYIRKLYLEILFRCYHITNAHQEFLLSANEVIWLVDTIWKRVSGLKPLELWLLLGWASRIGFGHLRHILPNPGTRRHLLSLQQIQVRYFGASFSHSDPYVSQKFSCTPCFQCSNFFYLNLEKNNNLWKHFGDGSSRYSNDSHSCNYFSQCCMVQFHSRKGIYSECYSSATQMKDKSRT